MADMKTYLNVPYAQKDQAKALGARWDATQKKWYIPPGKDRAVFSQWPLADAVSDRDASAPSSLNGASTLPASRRKTDSMYGQGVMTHPADADFVAYSGDTPPWD